jgi:integrase
MAEVLREHRRDLLRRQAPGLAGGWMFPAPKSGTLRRRGTLSKAYAKCLEAAGITRLFTIHGMRYTFTDLLRLADVDPVVRRSLVGHVTERMQHHYSSVALAEKRAAVAGVYQLVPLAGSAAKSGGIGGDANATR